MLGVRHRAALEPAVEHVADAPHRPLPVRAGPREVVDEVLVQVIHLLAAFLLKFGAAADDLDIVAAITLPDRDRVAPEAVAADGPVARPLEPLAEAPVLEVLGHPFDLFIGIEHELFDLLDVDEPGRERPIDERLFGAVAEWIGVQVVLPFDEQPLLLQIRDDRLVGVLDEDALPVADLGGEAPLHVDGADDGDAGALEHLVVILSEARRGVDDAAAVFDRDIVAHHADEGAGLLLEVGEVWKERLVPPASVMAALLLLDDFIVAALPVVVGEAILAQDIEAAIPLVAHLHVVDLRTEGEGEVGRQRPGGGRPGQEVRVLLPIDGETHRDGGVDHILIPTEVHLEVGERRGQGGAEGQNIVPFVDISFLIEGLEDPPDRLHVVGVHGAVAILPVDPTAHPVDGVLPLLGIPQHDGAALLVEVVHSEVDDGAVAADAQLLLHLVLDGQAVAVPAEGAVHPPPLHRLVAGDGVLDGPGDQVAEVRQPGRERRAVVKDVLILRRSQVDRLLEDLPLFPKCKDRLLHLRELHFCVHWLKHSTVLSWCINAILLISGTNDNLALPL